MVLDLYLIILVLDTGKHYIYIYIYIYKGVVLLNSFLYSVDRVWIWQIFKFYSLWVYLNKTPKRGKFFTLFYLVWNNRDILLTVKCSKFYFLCWTITWLFLLLLFLIFLLSWFFLLFSSESNLETRKNVLAKVSMY